MIGIFDSGLGGLSVLAAIARALPDADLTYLADTAHVPYGNKSAAFIRSRVLAIGRYLTEEQGCRMLVVACNTATAAAVTELRQCYPDLPVVGVEPGVKPAARASRRGRIGVLATEATAASERLRRLIDEHAGPVEVLVEACPGWATRVETLHLDDPEFTCELERHVRPLLTAGVDQIVLGCTHYSFLAAQLATIVGPGVDLVDVAEPVARQVLRLAGDGTRGRRGLQLAATAAPERLSAALPALGLAWLASRQERPPLLAGI